MDYVITAIIGVVCIALGIVIGFILGGKNGFKKGYQNRLEIGEKAIYSEDEKVALTVDLQTRGTIVLMGAGNMDKIMESIV